MKSATEARINDVDDVPWRLSFGSSSGAGSVVSARPHIVLPWVIAAVKGSAGSSRTAELNMKTVMFS
jgi:hypothetical protein